MRKVFIKPDRPYASLRDKTVDLLEKVMTGGPGARRLNAVCRSGAAPAARRGRGHLLGTTALRLLLDAVPTGAATPWLAGGRGAMPTWTPVPDDSWVDDSPAGPSSFHAALFSDLCLPEVAI